MVTSRRWSSKTLSASSTPGMPWGGKSKNWWSISSVLPMVLPQKAPKPARVSTLPLGLPLLDRILPAYTFDMRQALALHAQAIRAACARKGWMQRPGAILHSP